MKNEKKKILIVDADRALHQMIKRRKEAALYQFDSAFSGLECWEIIEKYAPDLIVIDLMLPRIHGMEILRKIKTDPRTQHIGVILCSYCPSSQNYHSALLHRVDYFLAKPFSIPHLFSLFQLYFKAELHPQSFEDKSLTSTHYYHPKTHVSHAYIKFWGSRGSNPVSGPDYVRFGGNTSCLEVRSDRNLVIFDAGTGIRPLGTLLSEEPPKDIHIILSHFHFDHLSGFPFFAPLYNPECTIHVWTPIGFEKSAREIFSEMFTYALFPVRLDDMQANVFFRDIQEGIPFSIGDIEINSHYAFHPGATLCFKIKCHKTVFGYVTDNEFLMGYHGHPNALKKNHKALIPYKSLMQFFKDCDLLIHEAQYMPAEYRKKVGWGHSSIANAAALLKYLELHDWIITHHDPKHTDLDLLKKIQMQYDILKDISFDCRVRMAFDGLILPLK